MLPIVRKADGGGRRPAGHAAHIPPRAPRPEGGMTGPLFPAMIADYFIASTGGGLTPLQVIKLTYIAHGYSLALLDEALIEEEVEAWKYGPVVPSVYHAAKRYGGRRITELLYSGIPAGDEEGSRGAIDFIAGRMSDGQKEVLDGVLAAYGEFTGFELTGMTRVRDAPWNRYYEPGSHGRKIPNHVIKSYYREIVGGGA